MFVQWLRNGINGLFGRATRRSQRPVRSRQLGLERLQDRSVPSATSGLGGQLPTILHLEGLGGSLAAPGLSVQAAPQGDTSRFSQPAFHLVLQSPAGPEVPQKTADGPAFHDVFSTSLYSGKSLEANKSLSYTKSTLKGEAPVSQETDIVYSYSQDSGGDRPTESFSLTFSNIKVMYTSQEAVGKATGAVSTVGWDIVTQKAS